MVIRSNGVKDIINQNSYDYKDFYSKTQGMKFLSYSIFVYPLRIAQSLFFDILFGEDKESQRKFAGDSSENKKKQSINLEFKVASDILKNIYPLKQLKFAGMKIQESFFQSETWINSLIILVSLYIILMDTKISLVMGIILFVYLFFALTSIAIEHSIYNNGFLLIEVFPKTGIPFRCRLMEIDGKQIKVLLKGESVNKEFNPVEYYPLNEISKIRYVSMGEMIDEF